MSTDSPTIASTLAVALRVPPGSVDLTAWPTEATPGFDVDKAEGRRLLRQFGEPWSDLQERLFAEGVSGAGQRAVLLVRQGVPGPGRISVVDRSHCELEQLAPQWPAADFDVGEQRGWLQAETA